MGDDTTHRKSVNQSLAYIERHLTQSIGPDDVAREGRFSQRHFYRIFTSIIGTTAANYIRDRRLTNAASELVHTNFGILDIALKYHFQSQESFTRAFKKRYGVTPGHYRTYSKSLIKKEKMDMSRQTIPQGWSVTGNRVEDYEIALDKKEVHSGTASVKLQSVKVRADGFATLMQMFSAERYLGKRVRLTAFVKAEDVKGWAGLWMRVDRKNGDLLQFDNMQNRPIKGTQDWKLYSVVLDVSEHSHAIAFGMLMSGEGKVWGDQFRFEEVDEKTPTTGQDSDDQMPSEPANLDFEYI
ncbi:helix-turn-helix transcriptional regulator [Paenibacillus harenae]|uniref:AraC-like DNA-binding protein n=1 Tax=Paenibacillus harenae TaxID=306543 RepID=A0ABT9U884_PAEHA|nr:helix-turn-helix transcriptional regulator [Paenibacillus harenae]MDQ0115846.1 AraC-like DNA-binding protein [Paenibacillus harenae]